MRESFTLPQTQIANTNVYSQYMVYKMCNGTIDILCMFTFDDGYILGVFEKPCWAFWDHGYPWSVTVWQIVFIKETACNETKSN